MKPQEGLENTNKRALVRSTRSDKMATGGVQIGGHKLVAGITKQLCGATHMASALAMVPPGKATKSHIHNNSETILFMVEGWGATLIGPKLEPVFHGPGDFVFIPEKTVHIGFNLSLTHRLVLTETRSHEFFSEDVILQPDFELKARQIITNLQKQFAAGLLPLPADWRELVGQPYSFS